MKAVGKRIRERDLEYRPTSTGQSTKAVGTRIKNVDGERKRNRMARCIAVVSVTARNMDMPPANTTMAENMKAGSTRIKRRVMALERIRMVDGSRAAGRMARHMGGESRPSAHSNISEISKVDSGMDLVSKHTIARRSRANGKWENPPRRRREVKVQGDQKRQMTRAKNLPMEVVTITTKRRNDDDRETWMAFYSFGESWGVIRCMIYEAHFW